VAAGGTAGQILSKVDATNYNTIWANPSWLPLAGGTITGSLTVNGAISAGGSVAAVTSFYVRAASGNVHLWFQDNAGADRALIYTASATQGDLVVRVGGTRNFIFGSDGSLEIPGNITSIGGHLISGVGVVRGSTTQLVLGMEGANAGVIWFRPNGWNTVTGQMLLNSAGTLDVAGQMQAGTILSSAFSTSGASGGLQTYSTGPTYASLNTSAGTHINRFYNPTSPYVNGAISMANAATSYLTSSDQDLKELNGEYSPLEAIDIIRADPVLGFTWKSTGEEAIGWFAQKSYSVDVNLAEPPAYNEEELAMRAEGRAEPKPGEEGYVPWMIDYGRRTPYLWAALTWALDEIDQLKATVAAMQQPAKRKKAA
jgi:hypothetical protein